MNYSLSDTDLLKLIPFGKVVKYNDLHGYKTIDDLVDKPCFILFETNKPNVGHWVCLFKNEDTCYFFDSYGIDIEKQKDYISPRMLEHKNYISILLKNSDYKVDYNPIQYQLMKDGIATCGRHCAVRIMCKHLTDLEYKHLIMDKCSAYDCKPDQLVCGLTLNYIGK